MKCPIHEIDLIGVETQYGKRFKCPRDGCTVACWNGKTSTPADDETRRLRSKCHELFDPLWRPGPKQIFKTRWMAYRELKRMMGTSNSKTHIGMFDKAQCLKLLAELNGDDS